MRIITQARTLRAAALLTLLTLGTLTFPGNSVGAPTGKPVAYAITPNNTITIIDTGSHAVLGTIPLAGEAKYIVGTPDGKQLYVETDSDPVGNPSGTGAVWVIDTQTNTIKTTLPLPLFPTGIVVSSDGARVYAASQFSSDYPGAVTVIDTASNTVLANITSSTDWSIDIALSPDGKRVYLPNYGDNAQQGSFDVIDTATNTVIKTLTQGDYQNQYAWTAVSPDSAKVYAYDQWTNADGTFGGGAIVYDATTYAVITFAPVGNARLTVPLPGSHVLYGIDFGSVSSNASVLVYNTLTDTVTTKVPVAASVYNLALTPDNKQLYVSNSNAQSIAILDTATNGVTGNVAVAGATGLTIVAAPPPPVLTPPVPTLQLSPTSVPPGSTAALAWTSTGATTCTASGAWSGAVALQGNKVVSFATPGSYTFTLTCTGAGGMASASTELTVIPGSTLSASATDLPLNGTTVLSWKGFSGATRCSGDGTWAGDLPPNGSKVVGPYSQAGTQSFTLRCGGPSGGDTVTRSITVFAPGALGYSAISLPNDNVNAVAVPGTPATGGGLDGHGFAYNRQDSSLPNPVTAFGQTFTLGSATKFSGISKQTIALGSAQLSNVTFLATAVNANQLNQPFVVTYSDGTTQTYTQSLSQWGSAQGYAGETQAAGFGTRITPTGALDHGAAGWWIYAYQITLDPTKVATSLRLPNNRNVIVLAVNATKAPSAVPVSISAAFNVTGLAAVGHPAAGGGLDNHGYAFDTSLLPSGFTGAGQKFTLGPANAPDAVSNMTIALPAQTRLGLTVLATAVNANLPDQTFLVTYQDGSTTLFTQGVSQWGSPQHYPGELDARSTAFRITPAGVRQAGAWHVYAFNFQTDPSKKVVSLTLPKNRNVVVLAVNSLTP